MANGGPDTNTSQFFITLCAAPHLDGTSIVFGSICSGMEILEVLQKVPVDDNDRPQSEITIVDCGEVVQEDYATA